ncbi:tetratricopeptide repeat protein [Halalkalibacterium halodurans]|uniref:tetratricopeptide repeat protein n=1 Tax=Halalkalibacterium halodurans TaxID=86665 RepID=UPI0010675833|nr:tetratricopeptide repeat protein [Halalkalibacterium halodurans]MED3646057.1 tetratricopeptide repeat protein [Halalkalibacterium halodurans]TES57766.1 tetratricopeptide repeat protein [Halalkalibacterium halodurans]
MGSSSRQGWRSVFKDVTQKWDVMTVEEQEKELSLLEEWTERVLEEWSDMHEACMTLRERQQQSSVLEKYPPYVSKGTALYDLEMFQEAAMQFDRELKMQPHMHHPLLHLYAIFANLYGGQRERCKEHCVYVLTTSVDRLVRYFTYMALGTLYMQEGEVEEALTSYEHASKLTFHPDVMYNLGMAYFLQHQYALAIPCFVEVIKDGEEDVDALYFLGCALCESGYVEEGCAKWLEAIQLCPPEKFLLTIGTKLEWYGFHQAAVHCFEQLLQSRQLRHLAKHGIAWNLALQDEREKAIHMLKELIAVPQIREDVRLSIEFLAHCWNDGNLRQLAASIERG